MIEVAPAKLNLALHVRARRPDGYHALETLFAFCTDGDLLHVARAAADRFEMIGPFGAALTAEADNLVLRARDAFRTLFGGADRLAVTLDKRLPIASGVGGGSADAAAMLRVMAKIADRDPQGPELMELAAELGSDVPACLLGRTAIGTGRGERLETQTGLAGTPVLLVNPGRALSTAAVFSGWGGVDHGALPSGDPLTVAMAGRNDLEPPALAILPVIGDVLTALRACDGTTLVRMSGSGATCFALFDDANARDRARDRIVRERPGWWCLATALA